MFGTVRLELIVAYCSTRCPSHYSQWSLEVQLLELLQLVIQSKSLPRREEEISNRYQRLLASKAVQSDTT